jgi:hypothetical protein
VGLAESGTARQTVECRFFALSNRSRG